MIKNHIIYYYYSVISRLRKERIYQIGVDNYYSVKRKYASGFTLPAEETSLSLVDLLRSGNAFFAGRYGANEMNAMAVYDLGIKSKMKQVKHEMCNGAGFFMKNQKDLNRFSEIMIDSTRELDYIAIWNLSLEEYYIKKYASKDVLMSRLRYFEPWYAEKPWTSELQGKKVVVIHPFDETIKTQYKKRKLLFDNKQMLPEFELRTVKAVQTIAGSKDVRFESWFDALDWMYEEALKEDFDVALIGCGAYGFPLAAKLKKVGKAAIHMGGVLQILFGIRGSRWNNDPVVSKLYNEHWVHPSQNERPKNFNNVEQGCYW